MGTLARPRLRLAGFRFDPQSETSGVPPLIYRIKMLEVNAPPEQRPTVWLPA